jgi:hypothetical protein
MKIIRAIIFSLILLSFGTLRAETAKETNSDTTQIQKIDTTITKSEISRIIKITGDKSILCNEHQDENPFSTRYSFTTSALPMKKGTKYATLNLLGPEVHFAISDNFRFGVLSSWIGAPLMLTLRYSFKTNSEKLNFSIGTLLGTTSYLNKFKGVIGMPYVNATFGDSKNNVTISTGYFYLNSKLEFGDVFSIPVIFVPEISIAGIVKLTPKTSFIYDGMFGNYDFLYGFSNFFPHLMVMPGVRFQPNLNNAFQVSLTEVFSFRYSSVMALIPIPSFSWFFKF